MQKITPVAHEIHPLLQKRWSPRSFSDKMISRESIERLFEAARWAPSTYNEQPWAFIIGTNEDEHYRQLQECINTHNRKWAGKAPLLGVVLAKRYFGLDRRDNKHYMYDAGLAVSDMIVQATYMNFYAHQLGGFHPDKVIENFNVPGDWEPICMLAIGYLGDPEELPEGIVERDKDERYRKTIDEFVFGVEFGKTSDWVK